LCGFFSCCQSCWLSWTSPLEGRNQQRLKVQKKQAGISDQNNRGPKTSGSTLVSIHRRNAPNKHEYITMEWEKFQGRVPKDAVKIREEGDMAVCRNMQNNCVLGILKGSTCEYEEGEEGKLTNKNSFEVLVNKDDFEKLEWKTTDCTKDVKVRHKNAVKLCDDQNLFVGRKSAKAKSLPAEKKKVLPCKVLTVVYEKGMEQEISDFKYEEQKKKETKMGVPNEELVVVSNDDKNESKHTVQSKKATRQEKRWDFTYTITAENKLTIGVESSGFKMAYENRFQATVTEHKGYSVVEEKDLTTSTQVTVPPNSKCTVKLVSSKLKVEIPFTAKLTRKYRRRSSKIKIVPGIYVSIVGKAEAKIEKCEPLDGNKASAGRAAPRKGPKIQDRRQRVRQGRSL
uniref:Uncharacterized protein n=1 Tax=Oryzias latipes TaxID=8090 RepID=A0A3P9K0Y2_ORYLA